MDEQPVRPGRARDGTEPIVADGKLARERSDDRQLVRLVALHRLFGRCGALASIIGNKAAVVDSGIARAAAGRISRANAAEMHEHVLEFVARIFGRSTECEVSSWP